MFSANCWLLAVTLYTRGTRRGGAKSQKSQVANGDIIPLNNKAIFLGGWPCQIHIRRRSLRNRIPVSKEQKAFWTLKSKQEFAVSLHTPIRTLDMRPEARSVQQNHFRTLGLWILSPLSPAPVCGELHVVAKRRVEWKIKQEKGTQTHSRRL